MTVHVSLACDDLLRIPTSGLPAVRRGKLIRGPNSSFGFGDFFDPDGIRVDEEGLVVNDSDINEDGLECRISSFLGERRFSTAEDRDQLVDQAGLPSLIEHWVSQIATDMMRRCNIWCDGVPLLTVASIDRFETHAFWFSLR